MNTLEHIRRRLMGAIGIVISNDLGFYAVSDLAGRVGGVGSMFCNKLSGCSLWVVEAERVVPHTSPSYAFHVDQSVVRDSEAC